jgi:hypothetical protein
MPVELRERLLEASHRSDRSLNAEIVDRLERSCRPTLARRAAAALRTVPAMRGEGFMKGRLRLTLAALSVLVLAGATVLLAVASGPSKTTRPSTVITAGEMPSALARHLATTQGVESEEGPGSAGEAAFRERAYPDTTISVAEMSGARAAFARAKGRHTNKGREKKGEWTPVGPSTALYPFEELRNAFLYVPNKYVAGGRTTSIAISSRCKPNHCVAYITPAGGGVWRTKNALSDQPDWTYLGGPLGINAAGSVVIDENDPSDNTVYVGTGEANICGSGCVAGTGLYRSRNGGVTWTNLGRPEFQGKGIGAIVIKPGDPDTLYVGSTTALRGMSSSCCSGVTRPVPGIAKWGLYKSTNAGQTWSFIHNGSTNVADCTGTIPEFNNTMTCSPRGVRHVLLDPSNPDIVYASSYARGVWRSNDEGATWTQIKPSINPAIIQSRAAITVTTLPNGKTRMYVHEGNSNAQGATANANSSRLFRSDDVATGTPTFTDMSSDDPAQPGFAFRGICDPQCWYDIFVYTPPGHPNMVYVGGDYFYGETTANKRGVVLSQDAGVSATDMTFDGTDMLHPNGIHPDQHSLLTIPGKPLQFIETGDGGVVRSSGELVDRSSWCDDPNRGLNAVRTARCKQMLSAIPSKIDSLNDGLSTLQFQSLSVSPHDVNILQGGTQDNGTWENKGSRTTWVNTMIGDGGQSGFDVAIPEFRMHNFTGPSPDVNFDNGELSKWIWTGGPLGGPANGVSEFYSPVITDPVVSKTMFAGTGLTAYRTKTAGLGTRTIAQAQAVCNEWTGTGPFGTCGDWARLGPTPLTDAAWGTRAGGAVAAVERTKADTSTAWAATSTGRVFISKNVAADPAASVTWTRVDLPTTPGRYVTSIYIDPQDGNHAWVSYSGYEVNTPSTPGHIFEVHFNGTTATWSDLSHNWGDLPTTDLVRDDVTGDLYAASDFGVAMLPAGGTNWVLAASGMPNVEVAGLTIVPSERILYAATHGLSAWKLNLNRK